MKIKCPKCNTQYQIESEHIGAELECTICSVTFSVFEHPEQMTNRDVLDYDKNHDMILRYNENEMFKRAIRKWRSWIDVLNKESFIKNGISQPFIPKTSDYFEILNLANSLKSKELANMLGTTVNKLTESS